MIKNALIRSIGTVLKVFFPRRPLMPAPQRIVVLKPCCLGDVVLATPAIAALHHRYPHAKIDVAVGSWSHKALQNNPHIHRLIDSGAVGQGHYTFIDILRLAQRLRRQHYDLAVILDRSPLVGLTPWLAGIRHRLGLDSFGRGFAHTVRVAVSAVPRHEARIYLDCVAATGVVVADTPQFWSEFYPAQTDNDALPPLPDSPIVIIHPAGGVNPGMRMINKRWPGERFSALADRFTQHGFAVVLTGTDADAALCAEIAAQITQKPPQILAGALTLGQFGALCRRATLFVGGDTGAMHVAVAVGCKTVAIFGPTDPRRYGPFAPSQQAVSVWREWELPAGGVGQGNVAQFSWKQGASVEEVWAASLQLLGENP